MRILHVIRGLTNSSGTTHIVIPLAEAQARLGMDVQIAHVDKPKETSLAPDPNWVQDLRYPLTIPLNNPGMSLPFARAMPAVIAHVDIVHVHAVWNFPSWWAMRCAGSAGKPYVVAPQGSFDSWAMSQNRLAKRIYGALTEMPLLRGAACLQALTTKEADQFRKAGLRGPVSVIPNGIPGGNIDRVPDTGGLARMLELPNGSRALLFLSRVHRKKGLDILLQAFRTVADSHSDIYLVIAGDDAGSGYRQEMEVRARDLGIHARCRFIGEVRGEFKQAVLLGADAFALISRSEGLPVAALEALGAGLPAVISSECNVPEVAKQCAGWVVEPSVAAASGALMELFGNQDEARERGLRARALIKTKFTWDQIAAETIEMYEHAIWAMSGDGSVR